MGSLSSSVVANIQGSGDRAVEEEQGVDEKSLAGVERKPIPTEAQAWRIGKNKVWFRKTAGGLGR